MKKIVLSIVAISGLIITSCSSDNDEFAGVKAPATYEFKRNGESTVSFSGQTTRIKMAEELVAALKDNTKTEEILDAMFAHEEGVANFSEEALNSSTKNIRSKTAASKDYFTANTTEGNAIKAKFDGWIKDQVDVVFPNWDTDAVSGTAGKIQEAGGGSTRYVNEKGLELNQAFAKSLIGALMVDQMLNNYLSPSVLDDANNVEENNSGTVASEKNYTIMEHKWDEAYGYLYGNEENTEVPVLGADSFLNKYVQKVDNDADFAGIAKNIYNAFKLGRAAIVAKDYTLRDKQIKIIRDAVSKIIAIRAVYYLQTAKASLATDKGSAFHDLSEGFGFVQSLRFTHNTSTNQPYFSNTEVDGFLSNLMENNGFWSVTNNTLDSISNTIAAKFDFTVAEAAN